MMLGVWKLPKHFEIKSVGDGGSKFCVCESVRVCVSESVGVRVLVYY